MNHHFRLHSGLLSLTALLCLAQPGISQVPHLLHHQGRVAVDGVNFNGTGQFKFALVDAGTDVSRQATATPVISNGYLTGVTVTDGGAGYASAPTATAKDIKTGGGSGARLQCTVSGGAVTGITVVDPGAAYTGFTTIQISAPPPSIVYQTWWGNAADTTPADGEPDAAITLTVTNGLFDVLLGDTTLANMAAVPASVFSNPDVRLRVWFDDGSHGFQQLSPDKRIAAVGYAVMADTVPDGAITTEKIAAGAVQSSNIDAGAVTSTKLATGAVQAANIAPGTITATQLAKPPRSGSIASSSLQFDFNQATFTVPFSPAFASTPVITLGMQGALSAETHASLWVESSGPASFAGRFSVPIQPLALDSNGDVGAFTALAIVNGYPAISYYDNSNYDLKFVLATNADGTAWGTPTTLDSSGDVGEHLSLAIVNGKPAISYYDYTNRDLKFVRATNASGFVWGTPVTIDSSGNVGGYTSLAIVNGYPAISYCDYINRDLKFVRATDANGTAWGTPLTLDSSGDVGSYTSLAIVNGYPAISYYDETNGDLKFVRSTNPSGTAWGPPLTPDSNGVVGTFTSLAIVNGYPAVSYYDDTNSDLKFIRATNASGTAWGVPITPDSSGDVGFSPSLAVVNGNPAISYYDNTNHNLKFVRAANADGTGWGTPITLDRGGDVGAFPSLAIVSGTPAISYYDSTNGALKFVRAPDLPPAFTIQWIALEP